MLRYSSGAFFRLDLQGRKFPPMRGKLKKKSKDSSYIQNPLSDFDEILYVRFLATLVVKFEE